ncbi:MAG: ABC transporter ATP-binding protein/permease [Gemmatimonadetes bacterium]|nr:ABC transporter ATP-binding protein/permease [Gemmatimonadota bacterium]
MPTPGRSSRRRYQAFVAAYRQGRLDVPEESGSGGDGARDDVGPQAPAGADGKRAARRAALREYLRWLRPHRAAVGAFVLLALAIAGLQMVEPLFMRHIVDRVLLAPGVPPGERVARLNTAGALFLALVVASNLLGALKDHRQRLLTLRVMLALRRALYDQLLHLPLPRLWEKKTGGLLSRLTGDVDTTTGLLQLAIVSPAIAVVRLAIAVAILTALNWRLALTAVAIIPGIMAISFIAARRIRPIYRTMRKDAELIDGRVGETFAGIRIVRAFRREGLELLEYLRGRHTLIRKELFAQRRELVLWTSWGLIMGAVNVVIVWYGGALQLRGGASIGDIMAFQWYTFLLLNPVWTLVNSFSELQRSLAATERVFEVLGMARDKPDAPDATDAPAVVREVALDGVGFAYVAGRPVLQDVTVTVPGGSVVALVGRSGAGKTTVTDLVARFHDPTAGAVRVNGTDIRRFRLRSYRGLLALVQQDTFLFDGSVRDNIAYADPLATDAEVEAAARQANAHEFIARLPEGYATTVGERGVKLSGGQQQRLAIARAFLARPQILILDEATSNLDTESEQLIQEAMTSLLAGRTTFVIAHRLSTVRRADLILVLDAGRVVERGTHEALMAAGGTYAAMVRRQAAQAEEEAAVIG